MFRRLISILRREEKKYAMPSKVGFIKWTDSATKYNLPIKKVEVIIDGVIYTYPYMGVSQIRILENDMKVPIIDLTGRQPVPKADILKVFYPDIVEVSRF